MFLRRVPSFPTPAMISREIQKHLGPHKIATVTDLHYSRSVSSHLSLSSHVYVSLSLLISLSSQLALSLLSHSLSLSLFSMKMAMCEVCVMCLCVVWCCVVLRDAAWCCVLMWLYRAVLCCAVLCVCAFRSCTENNAPVCTFSKRPPVCRQNAPVYMRHGRFDGTHESVLNVHTGASRADCPLSVCLSRSFCRLSFLLSLSLVGSLFLFSVPLTVSTRPVGSQCTHGSDLTRVPESVGIGPIRC